LLTQRENEVSAKQKEIQKLTNKLTTIQQKLTRSNTYQQNQIKNLQQTKNRLDSENQQLLTNYQQTQSQKLSYENYLQMALKVSHLNNLPINNSVKGLQELITYYNNHNPKARLISLKTQTKNVIAQYRDDQEINNSDLNTQSN
jgi:hypothetical protein